MLSLFIINSITNGRTVHLYGIGSEKNKKQSNCIDSFTKSRPKHSGCPDYFGKKADTFEDHDNDENDVGVSI